MAGKRTRKDKENAHHQFLYSWDDKDSKYSRNKKSQAAVNRDLGSELNFNSRNLTKNEKADIMAKEALIASTKKGVLKSLLLASLILISELVIYLAWK